MEGIDASGIDASGIDASVSVEKKGEGVFSGWTRLGPTSEEGPISPMEKVRKINKPEKAANTYTSNNPFCAQKHAPLNRWSRLTL